jgi:hypothetical protein
MSVARPSLSQQRSEASTIRHDRELQSVLDENVRLRQLIVRLSDIILKQVAADFETGPPTRRA